MPTMSNRYSPAYPESCTSDGYINNVPSGMTKRELVASSILVALISKHGTDHVNDRGFPIEHDWLYHDAIKATDKFFDELEKNSKP